MENQSYKVENVQTVCLAILIGLFTVVGGVLYNEHLKRTTPVVDIYASGGLFGAHYQVKIYGCKITPEQLDLHTKAAHKAMFSEK